MLTCTAEFSFLSQLSVSSWKFCTGQIARPFDLPLLLLAMYAGRFSRLLGGTRVDVYVGPSRRHWNLPERLLCHYSEFFTKAFTGNFQESINKSVELREDDEAVFELLVKWMVRNAPDEDKEIYGWYVTDGVIRFGPESEGSSDEDPGTDDGRSVLAIALDEKSSVAEDSPELLERRYRVAWVYMKLYVLADKLGMGSLQDQTIDRLRAKTVDIFLARLILWIYENTVPSSPLRRCAVSSVSSALLLKDVVPAEYDDLVASCDSFATDLIQALVDEAEEVVYSGLPFRGLCALHVHERGDACPKAGHMSYPSPEVSCLYGTDIWIFPAAKPVSYEEEHDIPSLTNRLRCELARVWDDISTRCSRSAQDIRTLRQVRLTLLRDIAQFVDQSAS